MFHTVMSNSMTSLSNEDNSTISYSTRIQDFNGLNQIVSTINSPQQTQKFKKKRNLPGNPDPEAEVIALSPNSLLATNRFICEICNKGFQRDQNLQLHRRGHNLPWKLKQRNNKEIKKKAYVCPEPTCVHHHPSRALGDLTGIKKHFCRKHGEKKWKCEKCSKIYAVQSDWKAHAKTCGTREYRCDCGTLFSRKDSFITHRAFCDALAEESARLCANQFSSVATTTNNLNDHHFHHYSLFPFSNSHDHHQHHHLFANPHPITQISLNPNWNPNTQNPNLNINIPQNPIQNQTKNDHITTHNFKIPTHLSPSSPTLIFPNNTPTPQPHKGLLSSPLQNLNVATQPMSSKSNLIATSAHLSATALLQKAATIGTTTTTAQQTRSVSHMAGLAMGELGTVVSHSSIDSIMTDISSIEFLGGGGLTSGDLSTWQKSDRFTRDFLGLTGDNNGHNVGGGAADVNVSVKDMLTYTGGVGFQQYERELRDHSLLKPRTFGFVEDAASQVWGDC